MTKLSLSAWQSPCNDRNERNSEIQIKNKAKIQLCDGLNNQLQSKVNTGAVVDKNHDEHNSCRYANIKYLSFSSAKKIIHRFLTCDRVILLPTIIPKITESELAKILNITPIQFRHLRKSSMCYKRLAKHVSPLLANLYCSNILQQPVSLHAQGGCNE